MQLTTVSALALLSEISFAQALTGAPAGHTAEPKPLANVPVTTVPPKAPVVSRDVGNDIASAVSQVNSQANSANSQVISKINGENTYDIITIGLDPHDSTTADYVTSSDSSSTSHDGHLHVVAAGAAMPLAMGRMREIGVLAAAGVIGAAAAR